jgi:diacylglycerol O-acyltransferase
MERMDTLDAEFLHLEDGIAHMHIGAACLFANPAPSFDDTVGMIGAKLHLIPRYRQRVRSVPFELGRPLWVDDPHFNLAYHLRHTALPAPADEAAFCRLMGRIMSQPLDRDRPLWETWLVEGLEGGHWALVTKVHHCMVDGIAGVELLSVLLDLEANTKVAVPEPWEPQPEPHGAAKVFDAWGGLATDVIATARGVPRAITHPATAIRSAVGTARGLARFTGDLGSTPPLSIEGSIGPTAAGLNRRRASATFERFARRSPARSTTSCWPRSAAATGSCCSHEARTPTEHSSAPWCRCRLGMTTAMAERQSGLGSSLRSAGSGRRPGRTT